MTEWAEKNTIQCEVIKIAMSQDKNGHILKLSIHPNDLPKDLILDPLGSRYVMVLAKLNDQDEVEPPTDKSEGERAVDSAGLLCRNKRFIQWLVDIGYADDYSEDAAIKVIRTVCGISSRSELRDNHTARARFLDLRNQFMEANNKGEVRK